jgi:hypothetical protein
MVLKISTAGNAAKTEGENLNGETFTLRQGCTNHGHQDSAKKYILPFPKNYEISYGFKNQYGR